jgi:adenine-specific DNA-methyltransferase
MSPQVLDLVRQQATQQLDPRQRGALGQFMTPSAIAAFMASMFSLRGPVCLLDAGAGVGSLTAALLDRTTALGLPTEVHAWEIDSTLRQYLQQTLADAQQTARQHGVAITTQIHAADFIEQAVVNLGTCRGMRFTHAILNPPYKKMGSASTHRRLLRKVQIETVNLYAAFVALAIQLLQDGGELVAIIPRSFCNGPYYRPFRELLLSRCAILQIHLFESRSKAFGDDDVLQENIIIHLVKGVMPAQVRVSTSTDAGFADLRETLFPFGAIVDPADPERYIHIPTLACGHVASPLFAHTLDQIGVQVCTGPVVDFRVREYWSDTDGPNTAPLLYPHHFSDGTLCHPKSHKKPNALLRHPDVDKWLMPAGHYVLVKRFSSKEERRRVVAHVVGPDAFASPLIGFENHWNVIHINKHGIDETLARGLAVFLNSSLLDAHFRLFSGHTQVNATDLRSMKYPRREQLLHLGNMAKGEQPSQIEIDRVVEVLAQESQ